jgi:hypothetical protein
LAIAIRYYALFLWPFYLFSLQSTWKKRLRAAIISLAPWLAVNLFHLYLTGTVEAKGLVNLPHNNYLLSMKLQVASWDNLYVFPLLYALLLLHRLYNRERGVQVLVRYGLIALFLLFATAYTGQSPHYWTWFLPMLVMATLEDQRLVTLHIAQVLCLAIYSFIGGRATAGYLLASIAPDFFWSLPSPVEVIRAYVSPEVVISLARTAFSAVTLWMAYLVFQRFGAFPQRDTYTEGAT